ncbi:putative transmembrane transport protein [Trypanosoma theileri]|uniref:Putative transmembrane transport protein n=1 Tax=Trypanosoma theileri TaxID=67003 RepID=A0A1X0P7G8_9TRYP|nr:putative transmembrane transport protein [Trypanosoma theileri]ORC92874.1 putative transmembrane transport protein [Trypanosoma theileri]
MPTPLNVNAREWRPTSDLTTFVLPASTTAEDPHLALGGNTSPSAAAAAAAGVDGDVEAPSLQNAEQEEQIHHDQANMEPPAYYPSFTQAATSTGLTGDSTLDGTNWTEEFERVMALTKELIERQMSGEANEPRKMETTHISQSKQSHASSADQTPTHKKSNATLAVDNNRFPALPGGEDEVRPLVSGKWVSAVVALKPKSSTNTNTTVHTGGGVGNGVSSGINNPKGSVPTTTTTTTSSTVAAAAATSSPSLHASVPEFDEFGRPLPPLTSKGNRRWKKPTKSQQKREMAQKNAFEAFANALLHSVSPFMAPLRERCKTSLPHIKVDQRFGKSGQPQSAVAQFVVAPLVTNYRPRHFHDLTPGDLMEFHYDFAQVLKQLKSANGIHFGYGPVWKRYAVPYCYVNCKEYRQEVLNLCPDEVPNMRVEPIYEDDIVKDITDVVLAVEELEPLQHMSIIQAMSRRVNLAPLFDAFDAIFQPIENYIIVIRDLHRVPSTFLIQTSQHEIEQKPSPLVLYNDPKLWYELPVVSRVRLGETTTSSGVSQQYAEGEGRHSVSASRSEEIDKRHSTGTNGNHDLNNRHSHNKSQIKKTSSLPVVLPVIGSVSCLLLTGFILWKRKSGR